jgi:hypothetical protein
VGRIGTSVIIVLFYSIILFSSIHRLKLGSLMSSRYRRKRAESGPMFSLLQKARHVFILYIKVSLFQSLYQHFLYFFLLNTVARLSPCLVVGQILLKFMQSRPFSEYCPKASLATSCMYLSQMIIHGHFVIFSPLFMIRKNILIYGLTSKLLSGPPLPLFWENSIIIRPKFFWPGTIF